MTTAVNDVSSKQQSVHVKKLYSKSPHVSCSSEIHRFNGFGTEISITPLDNLQSLALGCCANSKANLHWNVPDPTVIPWHISSMKSQMKRPQAQSIRLDTEPSMINSKLLTFGFGSEDTIHLQRQQPSSLSSLSYGTILPQSHSSDFNCISKPRLSTDGVNTIVTSQFQKSTFFQTSNSKKPQQDTGLEELMACNATLNERTSQSSSWF